MKMIKGKKSIARINYKVCKPHECNPNEGVCAAVKACSNGVMEQIDGAFEQPMAIYQEMCLGCGDCVKACPLDSIQIKYIT